MEWDRIGEQVRQEHDGLRKQLDGLETLACRVLVDELRLVGQLRCGLEEFRDAFQRHLVWEERTLERGGYSERAGELPEEHRRQEGILARVVEELTIHDRPAQMLAGRLLELIVHVRGDMDQEEGLFLGERPHRPSVSGC